LETFRESFHARFLTIRQTRYLINSGDFEVVFEAATSDEQEIFWEASTSGNIKLLKDTMATVLMRLTAFDRMTIYQLREIGRHQRIPNAHRLSKLNLIQEIKNVVQRLKENGNGKSVQPQQTDTGTENCIGCR
jgi:hypothetical protein